MLWDTAHLNVRAASILYGSRSGEAPYAAVKMTGSARVIMIVCVFVRHRRLFVNRSTDAVPRQSTHDREAVTTDLVLDRAADLVDARVRATWTVRLERVERQPRDAPRAFHAVQFSRGFDGHTFTAPESGALRLVDPSRGRGALAAVGDRKAANCVPLA